MLVIPPFGKAVSLDNVDIPRQAAETIVAAAIGGYGGAIEYRETAVGLVGIADGEPEPVPCDVAALRGALLALPEYVAAKAARDAARAKAVTDYQAAETAGLSPKVLRNLEVELGSSARDLVTWIISRTEAKP